MSRNCASHIFVGVAQLIHSFYSTVQAKPTAESNASERPLVEVRIAGPVLFSQVCSPRNKELNPFDEQINLFGKAMLSLKSVTLE